MGGPEWNRSDTEKLHVQTMTVWLHEIVKDVMISFKKAELSKFT